MDGSVFVIGADGHVGRRLCRLLVSDDRIVTGMHREVVQFESVVETGATSLIGDVITDGVSTLARWMAGHDAIVLIVDGARGAGFFEARVLEKAVVAAQAASIERFVLVTGLPVAGVGPHRGAQHAGAEQLIRTAEGSVRHSGLDWIIVRHGALDGSSGSAGSGRLAAGPLMLDAAASAGHVAAFVARILSEPVAGCGAYELTDGDLPVTDVLTALTGDPDGEAGQRLLIA